VYLAYGSNIDPGRLAAYVDGSDAGSPWGSHRGSTDRTPTRVVGAGWLRGRLCFGGRSRRWGGGVAHAHLGHRRRELFVVRYEISRRQFLDLVSQENGGAAVALDWEALAVHGAHRCTDGAYATVAAVGGDGGGLLVTGGGSVAPQDPSEAYLTVVRSGLRAYLDEATTTAYLGRSLAR
jgi:hypothetical protein